MVRDALALEVLARVQRDFFALGDIHGGERVFGDLAAARHAHVGVAVAITVAKGRPLALAQLFAPYLVMLRITARGPEHNLAIEGPCALIGYVALGFSRHTRAGSRPRPALHPCS